MTNRLVDYAAYHKHFYGKSKTWVRPDGTVLHHDPAKPTGSFPKKLFTSTGLELYDGLKKH